MKTGTGSYGLDLLVLGALIVGGTWCALWFITSPHDVQGMVISKGISLTTFLLAQPGLIGGVKLMTITEIPARRRFALCAFVVVVFGIAIPLLIGNAIEAKLASFF